MSDSDNNEAENRKHPRRPVRMPVYIQSPRQGSMKAQSIEISQGGISVMGLIQLTPGDTCSLHFSLPMASGKQREVDATAKVIYSNCVGMSGFKTGFQFKSGFNGPVE